MRRIFLYALLLAILALFLSGSVASLLKAITKSQLSAFGLTAEAIDFDFPLSIKAGKVVLQDGTTLSEVVLWPTFLGELKAQGKVFEGVFKGVVSANTKRVEFSDLQSSLLPKVGDYLTGLVQGSFEEAKSLSIILQNGTASYEKILPKIEIDSLKVDGDLEQGTFRIDLVSKSGELRGELKVNGIKLQGTGVGRLTEVGAKEIGAWLAVLGGNDIKADEEFTISVLGSVASPMVKVLKR